VIWPPPDWTGVYAGAWRPPELAEEEEEEEPEPAEPEPFEAEPDEPEPAEPEPVPAVPPDAPLPADELVELLEDAVLWVEPGSAAATAPAATTLAKPTVAVATFSRWRPRSRSATAREMLRPPWRDPDRVRGDPLPNPALLMPSVWHAQLQRLLA
jgi:hypothetical protein